MIEIGRVNNLLVIKREDWGIYLDGEEFGNILLPKRYVPDHCPLDSRIDVFIYFDSEDRIIATTETPLAMVEQFAYLKVAAATHIGAFLDWGLPKDILVPFREQKVKMQKGNYYLVYIYYDEKSQRIAASAKIDKYLSKYRHHYKTGQAVSLLISSRTDAGYNAIIDNTYRGLIHNNDIFQPISIGQKLEGFIKRVRDDQKIDLILEQPGYDKIDALAKKILMKLRSGNGYIKVSDKSSPETISGIFGISKKNYKKAAGALYKNKFITIEENAIRLTAKGENYR